MQQTLWDDTPGILEEWATWQTAQGLSERTITERIGTVRALFFVTGTTPHTLDARAIVRYCARPHLSASSKASYHASIRAFCAWMQRAKVRHDNPSDDTPRPKRPRSKPRALSSEHVAATYAAANRTRTRIYIMLAVLAGLRVHEIAKIHGRDFDLELGALIVTGKGSATEILPLHDDLAAVAARMPRAGYWFPPYAGHGEHVTRAAVYAAIKGAMNRAGIDATPHQLRHSYGTQLLRRGANLRTVQKLMRHQNVATTQLYTDPDWSDEARAIGTLTFQR
jgi:Site-specific recombinase XerD